MLFRVIAVQIIIQFFIINGRSLVIITALDLQSVIIVVPELYGLISCRKGYLIDVVTLVKIRSGRRTITVFGTKEGSNDLFQFIRIVFLGKFDGLPLQGTGIHIDLGFGDLLGIDIPEKFGFLDIQLLAEKLEIASGALMDGQNGCKDCTGKGSEEDDDENLRPPGQRLSFLFAFGFLFFSFYHNF